MRSLATRGLTKNSVMILGRHTPIDLDITEAEPPALQLTFPLLSRQDFDAMLDGLGSPDGTAATDRATWETEDQATGTVHTFSGCFATMRLSAASWPEAYVTITLVIALEADAFTPPARSRYRSSGAH